MFLATIPRVDYRDPWDMTFSERRAALLSGSPRVAYYYTEPDTSTFRYRAFNMIEALRFAEPDASASWITGADGAHAITLIDEVDVLVVCRALYAPHIAAVIARANALGKRVLFDVDDLIFDHRYAHLVMETLDQVVDEEGLQSWFGKIARCGATMRLCDGVIATNEFLAARVRRYCGLPTWVIPNFLNQFQISVSETIRNAKTETNRARDRHVDIGYFSGTPSHNRDFALVEPTLAALLDSEPSLRLRIVGFAPHSDLLAPYHRRIETIPLQDFMNLQRSIGEVELSIVPLQDNEFTNCKSELKYFEAAVAGTVTVGSPTYCLRRAIVNEENGFIAAAHEWHDVLQALIGSVDELASVADRAAEHALARYSPQAQAPAIRAALLDGDGIHEAAATEVPEPAASS